MGYQRRVHGDFQKFQLLKLRIYKSAIFLSKISKTLEIQKKN